MPIKCLRAGKSYEKNSFFPHSYMNPAAVKCTVWLLSTQEVPTVAKAQDEDFWESILCSHATKSIILDLTATKMYGVARERSTVRIAWFPQ